MKLVKIEMSEVPGEIMQAWNLTFDNEFVVLSFVKTGIELTMDNVWEFITYDMCVSLYNELQEYRERKKHEKANYTSNINTWK